MPIEELTAEDLRGALRVSKFCIQYDVSKSTAYAAIKDGLLETVIDAHGVQRILPRSIPKYLSGNKPAARKGVAHPEYEREART